MEQYSRSDLFKEINLVKIDKQMCLNELEREKQMFIDKIRTNGLIGIENIKEYNKPIKIKKSFLTKLKNYFKRFFSVIN